MKSKRANREYWLNHVVSYQQSGLSRRSYCEQNNLNISSLDYWRNKLKSSSAAIDRRNGGNSWVTLRVGDPAIAGIGSGIRLRIGRLAIEVESGFDEKLLADVLRVAGSAC